MITNEETKTLEYSNLKLESLQDKIDIAKQKRADINHLIETIQSSKELSNVHVQFNNLLAQANEALSYVDENISLLSNLKNNLIRLENTISDFNSNSSNVNDINLIRSQIFDIDQGFTTSYNIISLNDSKINDILSKIKCSDLVPKNDIENASSISITTTDATDLELLEDHNSLIISEKAKSVFLPYTIDEIKKYIEKYPDTYSSYKDVILKQFVLDIAQFNRFPIISRFKEGYSLMRDCEAKSVSESIQFGLSLMFKSNLYPAIIPACKSEAVLKQYLTLLDSNCLDEFTHFKIKFEINPSKIYLHNFSNKKDFPID